jgi:hypothetical protein
MDWLYIWSPRYQFFHELLQATTKDCSGLRLQGIFADQHLFTPLDTTSHFLRGIPIKIHVIVNYIRKHIGETFFFSDVDLCVMSSFSASDLDSYKQYDITAMKENHSEIQYNIGCLLIKCTPETLQFFERVSERIRIEKLLDQDVFNQEFSSFSLSIGTFDENAFLQSNVLHDNENSFKIIQCLSSNMDKTHALVEKVLSAKVFFDVSDFVKYLPPDVLEILADLETQERMCES